MFFKIGVKKFSSALMACAAVFMCSCSDGRASANGDYVRAVETLEKSFSAFGEGDFSKAAELARGAEGGIRGIVKNYPDSDISLKIVSDPNLHLGDVSYAHFRKSLLPKLELAGDSAFEDFDISWAIALFADDAAKVAFANCLGSYPETFGAQKNKRALKKLSPEAASKMFDKILADVFPEGAANAQPASVRGIRANPRAEVISAKLAFENPRIRAAGAQPDAAQQSAAAAAREKFLSRLQNQPPQIENSEKFLAEAKKNAAMASYNLEASAKLLAASKSVSRGSAEFSEFAEALNSALANAKKISSKKLRMPALKNIILAMSQIGCSAEALAEAASNPDCADMRQDCFCVIAENLIKTGDLANAEAVVDRLENPKQRSMFYAHLARVKLSANDFEGARAVAEKSNDAAGASAVLLEQAAHLWDSDQNKALEVLAKASPQGVGVENLNSFLLAAGIGEYRNPLAHIVYADRHLEISALLAGFDKNAALKWLGTGALIAQNAKGKDAERLNDKICKILIAIKSEDAVAYALKLRGKIPLSSLLGFAQTCAANGDSAAAMEFFEMAWGVCAGHADAVKTAFAMQASNMERAKILPMAKEYLPKFK